LCARVSAWAGVVVVGQRELGGGEPATPKVGRRGDLVEGVEQRQQPLLIRPCQRLTSTVSAQR